MTLNPQATPSSEAWGSLVCCFHARLILIEFETVCPCVHVACICRCTPVCTWGQKILPQNGASIWPICYSFFEDCLIRPGSQVRGGWRENSPQQWRGNSFVSSSEKEPSWKAKFCIYQLISVLILTHEPAGRLASALGMVKRSQRSQVRLRGHPEASLVPIWGGFGGCLPLEGESRGHPGHTKRWTMQPWVEKFSAKVPALMTLL